MKSQFTSRRLTVCAGLVLVLPFWTQAQPTSHYCPGSEGLLGASVPPPGFYFRDYNIFYTADQVNNSTGHSAGPPNFNVFTYAQVPRFVWIPDVKVLGGNIGVNALEPFVAESVTAGPYHSSSFTPGDLLLDAFMAWHPQPFDFVFAAGDWIPIGETGSPPNARAGLGYWGTMITAGVTWHIDKEKTWSISLLNRYEINGEQRDTHITPGQAETLEWGIGKKFAKCLEAGISGYYQGKMTRDSGMGSMDNRDSAASIGPEIKTEIPKIGLHASLRFLYEFMADNRAQGEAVVLTLTKRF